MKNLCLLSLMITVPASAFATQDLVCRQQGGGFYQVAFDTESGEVSVKKYDRSVDTLECVGIGSNKVGVIANCYSTVRDEGGYTMDLVRAESGSLTVNLYKDYYMHGNRLVATLPCGK